jgi:YegS/Rv2252/BmrU family lipid kinase
LEQTAVSICVIFNPTARGEKARRFRKHLDEIGTQATLKLTTAPGDAQRLAAEAISEGFDTVVAAGGDGTVNEVLNGMGAVSNGFERARLGVLPLGTVNVFARELTIPLRLKAGWNCICQGRETQIDLPRVEFWLNGSRSSRYFVQLAGAGLDARAIELVEWKLKKKFGPVAYVIAGLRALLDAPAQITAKADGRPASGGLVLIGNGRLYGGPFQIFPKANLRDGLLDVCVFPQVNWWTLARCGPQLLLCRNLPSSAVRVLQGRAVELSSPTPTPFEVDGELLGHLPASISLAEARLRVIVP